MSCKTLKALPRSYFSYAQVSFLNGDKSSCHICSTLLCRLNCESRIFGQNKCVLGD